MWGQEGWGYFRDCHYISSCYLEQAFMISLGWKHAINIAVQWNKDRIQYSYTYRIWFYVLIFLNRWKIVMSKLIYWLTGIKMWILAQDEYSYFSPGSGLKYQYLPWALGWIFCKQSLWQAFHECWFPVKPTCGVNGSVVYLGGPCRAMEKIFLGQGIEPIVVS